MKWRTKILPILFLLFPIIASAQWAPSDLTTSPKLNPKDSGKVMLHTDIVGFFKNNEYFSPIAKGETLPGTRFTPTVAYQIGSQFRADIGFVGLYFSGDQQKEGVDVINSIFARMQYSINENTHLVLGNYYGGVNHRLIEPLYKWERHLVDRSESGIQFMYEGEKHFADVWVDWQRFIVHGDSLPEILTFGVSTSHSLTSDDSPLQLSIPFQLCINHKGGQIDVSEERGIVAGNAATGLSSSLLVGDGFIKNVGLDLYAVGYYDNTPNKPVRIYDNGFGFYPVLKAESEKLKFMTGYWHAKKFYSFGGEPLFRSFSEYYPDAQQPTRNLLTTKFAYSHSPRNKFSLGAQFETYTDLDRGATDYSFGVHVRFNGRLF